MGERVVSVVEAQFVTTSHLGCTCSLKTTSKYVNAIYIQSIKLLSLFKSTLAIKNCHSNIGDCSRATQLSLETLKC